MGALLSAVVLVYVLSKGTYLRHARGIRNMKTVRNWIVAVYSILLALNVWCAMQMTHALLCDAVAGTTLVATATLAAVVAERRIPATTVVERR
ncbi:hypothetical protein, partial [Kocuria rosea]|uniref:hypothetical protein n=1 Tax=Kocuria rosea TaxID=1275 RepID=UPI0012FB5FB0